MDVGVQEHGVVAHWCSIHLSGIVNGSTQFSAFAGAAVAVAVAETSTLSTPKSWAISVVTGFSRAAVRYTVTCTRSDRPVTGFIGNVTSSAVIETCRPATLFASAVLTALVTAGPLAEWLLKSL